MRALTWQAPGRVGIAEVPEPRIEQSTDAVVRITSTADVNALKVGPELPDDRYLFLSDILPTAWQALEYARPPEGGVLGVIGLGPVGQFVSRIARYRGHRVVAVEPVPERRAMAERHGVDTFDLSDDVADWLREATDGRGPDAIVDAVGMEAHGSPVAALAQSSAGRAPRSLVVAQALADVATIGILQERNIRSTRVMAEQLQTALDSGILIEQAKGVLSATAGRRRRHRAAARPRPAAPRIASKSAKARPRGRSYAAQTSAGGP